MYASSKQLVPLTVRKQNIKLGLSIIIISNIDITSLHYFHDIILTLIPSVGRDTDIWFNDKTTL